MNRLLVSGSSSLERRVCTIKYAARPCRVGLRGKEVLVSHRVASSLNVFESADREVILNSDWRVRIDTVDDPPYQMAYNNGINDGSGQGSPE